MKDDIRKTQADLIRAIKTTYQISDGIIYIKDPTGKYARIALGTIKLYDYKK